MVLQTSESDVPVLGDSFRLTNGTLLLDRRQFLRLTAAAGMVAAATAAGFRISLAQDGASPADVPDVVTAMAATLGHDLERIFRFVQEEVRYEPYAGILRGANGTLVARAGNSADQALLLAELLKASSIPVRFVTGSLDDAAAQTLMATTVMDAETAREQTLQSLLSDEDLATGIEWSVSGDASPQEVAELLDLKGLRTALEQDRQELGTRAAQHTMDSIDIIQTALATAGVALPSSVTEMPPQEQGAHVWVQAADGPGWIDLDASVVDLAPGVAVAAVGETVDSLPDDLRHRVSFTVTAETFVGGGLTQEPILEVSAFADELAYLGLVFTHARAEDLGGIDLIGSGLSEGTRYNPVLIMGPSMIVGQRSISLGGGGGGDLMDAFGGGGGEGLVEGETSAEWLEVSVTSPDVETIVARRAIFDRIGQVMRDSGVIDPYVVPPAELLDLGDGVGAQFLPCRSVRAFLVSGATPNLKMLIQQLALDESSGASILTGGFDATRALLGAEMAESMGCIGFEDGPAVASLVIEPTSAGITRGLDIWHRTFGSLGLAGVLPTAPPAMIAGVIPHAVERVAMEMAPTAEGGGVPVSQSVGAVFEMAAAQGIPTKVFADTLPPDAAYSPEHRERIQQVLGAGRLVIAPDTAVDLGGKLRLGWWVVDPVTGATVDEMDDGGGAVGEDAPVYVVMSSTVMVSATLYGPQAIRLFTANGRAIRGLEVAFTRATSLLQRVEIQAKLDFRHLSGFIPAGPGG